MTTAAKTHHGVGLTILLGSLTATAALSTDLYLPAVPTIADALGASLAGVQSTLSVFFTGMAVGQLAYGPLADRYGRRRPLLAGLLLYTLASIACALAPDVGSLWLGRLAQALGGCAGIVVVRAIVRDLFDVVESARMFARMMLVMGVAPIFAPLAGAWILDWFGWRATLWALALFGVGSLAAVWFALPETHAGTPSAARPRVVARTFLAILRDRTFLLPALVAALGHATLFTYIVSSPAVLIDHYGLAPGTYGILFGLNGCALIAASQVNARLLRRHGPTQLLRRGIAALLVVSLALLAIAWTELGGPWGISVAWFCQLACMGFTSANAAARALAHQGPRAGSASALLGSVQFGTGSVAGTVVAALAPAIGGAEAAVGVVTLAFAVAAFACERASREPVVQSEST